MRYETVTQRIGEYLGPVNWDYDFRKHFNGYCTNDEQRDKFCAESVAMLRKLAEAPERYRATTDGGWPKIGFKEILTVGMYDGWPYWHPVPSVLLNGTLGPEWHAFSSITEIVERREREISP